MVSTSGLLRSVFETLEGKNILYCLLRDCDSLDQFHDQGGELDLLVHEGQFERLRNLLADLGFFNLQAWGHEPHHFFFGYDRQADLWYKLDVVTEIAYGQPDHELRTGLADICLSNRRRCGFVFSPSPEDEFVTLLLHCLLDKGDFPTSRRERLTNLCRDISDEKYLSALLEKYWSPDFPWFQLKGMIEGEQWNTLLAERRRVASDLAGRNQLAVLGRQTKNRALRKMNRWRNLLRPQSPLVALLAPDGAGKSTLVAAIQRSFTFPVHPIYMGLYQKGATRSKRSRRLGFGFAQRLLTQWARYLVARYQQGRGRLVVFDRYTYDSLLPSPHSLTKGKQWRRWLLAHALPAPDLVILLDAPGEVLYGRKGEHSPMILELQRQAYLELQPYLPQMVVLDATRDPEIVRREVISSIMRAYNTSKRVNLFKGDHGLTLHNLG